MTTRACLAVFCCYALLCACSETAMTGSSSSPAPHNADAVKSAAKTAPTPAQLGTSEPGQQDSFKANNSADQAAAILPPASPPPPSPPPPVVADDVVDGEDVVNDCGRCLEHAKALSAQINFSADISRTYNEGFYKIPPSRGLCDIHFMKDMRDRIAEHEGHDSILGNQVALYCPCNCGWARDESSW